MKLCTVTTMMGLDGREHFGIVALGQPNWPLAICGLTDGPNRARSYAEAQCLADAPAMLDVLEVLSREFGAINPEFPLGPGKMAELMILSERAARFIKKHAAAGLVARWDTRLAALDSASSAKAINRESEVAS
jgi:hypothetical protein